MPMFSPPAATAVSPSGSSRPSAGRLASASISRGAVSGACVAFRSASASGRYGTLSPSSAQCPDSTVKPDAAARRVTSVTSRVLPTPASPLTSATTAWRDAASSSSVSMRANSMSRPTSLPHVASCSMSRVSHQPRTVPTH